MQPKSFGLQQRRPWEPRTLSATHIAEEFVDTAYQEQLQHRRKRNEQEGKRTRTNSTERRTVEALVLDVLAHQLTEEDPGGVSIRLDTNWLRGSHPRPTAVNTGVRDRLTDLSATGWLLVNKGNNHGKGQLTTISAGPRLNYIAQERGLSIGDLKRDLAHTNEVFLSRRTVVGDKVERVRVQFQATKETEVLRAQVQKLNHLFASTEIAQLGSDNLPIDLSRRVVHRSFMDGRFDRGGRLGGSAFWLNLRKDRRRQDLILREEAIAEVDLVAALPAIAYGLEGRTMWDDPYSPPSLDHVPRGPLKTAFVTFLWAQFNRRHGRFPSEVSLELPKELTYAQVYDALCRHNQLIAHYLGAESPRGSELMWHESEIIIDSTLRCYDQGFPALPIHDALVVPVSCAKAATKALSDAFISRLKVSPMITHQSFGREAQHA